MLKRIPTKMSASICIFALVGCLAVGPLETAVSANTAKTDINIIINDQQVVFTDQYPAMIEDRTYVPLRVISENLGAQVDWIDVTRQVVINRKSDPSAAILPNKTSEVQIIIDGEVLVIPADYGKSYISNSGRTMIPLRAVSEALGCEVNWNNENGVLVSIKTQTPPTPIPDNTVPPVTEPLPETVPQPENPVVKPPVDPADSQILKDLAGYKTNLKLKDGSVINSEILLTKDPSAFTPEQLSIFKTYREQLSKYQPNLRLPDGQTINTADITILGNAYLTADQLNSWMAGETPRLIAKAAANGQQFKAIPDLADLYIRIGAEYGIRGDLAFCQAAKETGYWQFTGSVQPQQNNYCGLWATGSPLTGQESLNGSDPNQVHFEAGMHGAFFASPEAGVEAHIQHLYAYATRNPLPAGKVLVDPRFVLVNKGIAPTWQQLNARWAVPGTTYGQSIIYDYWYKAANPTQ